MDESADQESALEIIHNAKVQRPSTCNALETLLVHRGIADEFLPKISTKLHSSKVELRGDEYSLQAAPGLKPATNEDWKAEYGELNFGDSRG